MPNQRKKKNQRYLMLQASFRPLTLILFLFPAQVCVFSFLLLFFAAFPKKQLFFAPSHPLVAPCHPIKKERSMLKMHQP